MNKFHIYFFPVVFILCLCYSCRTSDERAAGALARRVMGAKAKADAVQPREKSIAAFKATDWGWKPVAGSYVEAGSATMWNVDDGVMNHPYDNSKFDHAGERVVPNALIVK